MDACCRWVDYGGLCHSSLRPFVWSAGVGSVGAKHTTGAHRGAVRNAEVPCVGCAHGVPGVGIGRRFAVPVRADGVEVVRGGIPGAHGHLHSLLDLGAQDRDAAQAGHGVEILA